MATPATGDRLRLNTCPSEIWLHIDHFRKKSRRVWAVQEVVNGKPTWRVATKIRLTGVVVETRYHQGRKALQPIAYLVAYHARTFWQGETCFIFAPERQPKRRARR